MPAEKWAWRLSYISDKETEGRERLREWADNMQIALTIASHPQLCLTLVSPAISSKRKGKRHSLDPFPVQDERVTLVLEGTAVQWT